MGTIRPLKNPRRYPPDQVLAKTGYVKRLFDRITGEKDTVIKRTPTGKPIFGPRKAMELSGLEKNISDEVVLLEERAVGRYRSKDCEVYVVRVDHDLHVAEAIKKGLHLWSGKDSRLDTLLKHIYVVFPKNKECHYKPKTDPNEMDVQELENLLARKRVDLMSKSQPSIPVNSIPQEKIQQMLDPKVIEKERREEMESGVQKTVTT